MMKIFYIPEIHNRGGVERSFINLINAMVCENHENICVVVNYLPDNYFGFELDKRLKIVSLDVRNYKKNYLKLLFRLLSFLKKQDDCYFINVEVFSMIFTLIPMLVIRKVKFSLWEHFNFLNNNGKKLRGLLRVLATKLCYRIVVLTERDRLTWIRETSISGERIVCIGNINSFEGKVVGGVEDGENNVVLAVGRLVDVKNFSELIDIWSVVISSGKAEGWILKIIGGGELYEVLSKKIKDSNLESSLFLVGESNEVEHYYRKSKILCLTSKFEGLPMTLIEGQSMGLPIISYDCYTGPSEIVSEYSGFLVTEGDISAFSERLIELCNNKELRESMRVAAIEESSKFSSEVIVSKWIKLFENEGK